MIEKKKSMLCPLHLHLFCSRASPMARGRAAPGLPVTGVLVLLCLAAVPAAGQAATRVSNFLLQADGASGARATAAQPEVTCSGGSCTHLKCARSCDRRSGCDRFSYDPAKQKCILGDPLGSGGQAQYKTYLLAASHCSLGEPGWRSCSDRMR